MTYQLAKKLKDAGFAGANEWFKSPYDEILPAPTLEELIEACGEKFYGLHRMVNSEWLAFMYDIEDSTRQLEVKGATSFEAVANLWLELHKK